MGKNIIQQARGKGGPTYRSPSHRFHGRAKHKSIGAHNITGKIKDFVKCPGHSSPLAKIEYEDGEKCIVLAAEGLKIGDDVVCGNDVPVEAGNTTILKEIPEGTLIYNIENSPGDGGKFCRSAGTFARVISRISEGVVIQLPSKKRKTFNGKCRANIGIIAAGGKTDKPFLKAGKKYHAMRAKNKLYPRVSGGSMNAVDHPYGCSRSSRSSKVKTVSRHAPPGRKVGMISAKRTGRKKR